jgi:hypothetical protein
MQCISVDKKITMHDIVFFKVLPLGFPFLFAVDRCVVACVLIAVYRTVIRSEQTRRVGRQRRNGPLTPRFGSSLFLAP